MQIRLPYTVNLENKLSLQRDLHSTGQSRTQTDMFLRKQSEKK